MRHSIIAPTYPLALLLSLSLSAFAEEPDLAAPRISATLLHSQVPLIWNGRWIVSSTFSPDGTLFVTAGDSDPSVRMWHVPTLEKFPNGIEAGQFPGHDPYAYSVFFSADGKSLFTSDSKATRIWDVKTKKMMAQFGEGYFPIVSGDGKWMTLNGGDSGTTTLYDLHTKKSVKKIDAAGRMAFSPDSAQLWSLHREALKVYALPSGEEVLKTPCSGIANQFAFSADGKTVAALVRFGWELGRDMNFWNELFVWDAATGKERLHLKGPDSIMFKDPKYRNVSESAEALSNDAALSIWREYGKARRVREVATGKLLFEIPKLEEDQHPRRPFFLHDNKTAILWAEPNGLRAWNPAWKSDRFIPFPDATWPDRFILSPDGKLIAGIRIQAVRFWQLNIDTTSAEK